jgi:hypothetical protein
VLVTVEGGELIASVEKIYSLTIKPSGALITSFNPMALYIPFLFHSNPS